MLLEANEQEWGLELGLESSLEMSSQIPKFQANVHKFPNSRPNVHTEESFSETFVLLNRIWIVISLFRLIWHQMLILFDAKSSWKVDIRSKFGSTRHTSHYISVEIKSEFSFLFKLDEIWWCWDFSSVLDLSKSLAFF